MARGSIPASMGVVAVAVAVTHVLVARPAAAQEVADSVYTTDDGVVAVRSIEAPAKLAETWRAFTTSEGVMDSAGS